MAETQKFSPADSAVFACMLVFSLLIGLFYAIRQWRAKSSTVVYLLAGRKMSFIPVAFSLAVSYMSTVTMLGIPADMYRFGGAFWWNFLSLSIVVVVATQIFIPIYYRLGITSTYEYLEKRFNIWVRVLAVVAFNVETLLYLGINIYGPSLALNAVTGINMSLLMLTTGLVCTIYTMLGGLKAVIWTDVFQALIMVAGLAAVVIKVNMELGGIKNVWSACEEGGRFDMFSVGVDPRVRSGIWSFLIGGTVHWMSVYCVNQPQVQRYLSCKSEKHAKLAVLTGNIGMFALGTLSCLTGLTMYAYYRGCDPLSQKCVTAPDQLLPYMVMELFGQYPGLPGFFVSAVFAASLSTVSSGINALTTVTIEDLVKKVTNWSDWKYTLASKVTAGVYGLVIIGIAYLVSVLGDLLSLAVAILGLIEGPLLGLISMGMLYPFVNTAGSIVGFFVSLGISVWRYVGSKGYRPPNYFSRALPLSIEQCTSSCIESVGNYTNTTALPVSTALQISTTLQFNSTTTMERIPWDQMEVPELTGLQSFYSLAYFYTAPLGLLCFVVVSVLVSLLTGGWSTRKSVDHNLLILPGNYWMFSGLPDKVLKFLSFGLDMKSTENSDVPMKDLEKDAKNDKENNEEDRTQNGESNVVIVNNALVE